MAACTSPHGVAGGITWNGTDSVIWCDGTNWYALKNAAGSSGSAGYIQFSNGLGGFSNSGTTAGQQLFWDNTNKRLGIGTVTPSANLEAHSYWTQARLKSFNEWPTRGAEVLLARSRGWAIGTPQHVLLRDAIGVFAGVSNNGGTDSWAGMSVYATQDHSDTAHGMGLSFFTTPNDGVNALTRMIISQSGNIGIGTDIDPIYTLTFAKEGTRTIGIERSSPNNNGSNLIVTAGGAVPSVADKGGGSLILSSGIATGTGSSSIVFRTATPQASTATTDNTPTDKMTILGNGNVGIGTVAPANKLSVVAGSDTWATTFYGLSSSNTVRIGTLSGVATIGANNNAGNAWAALGINPGGDIYLAQNSGNVGIGTATPANTLDVNGALITRGSPGVPAIAMLGDIDEAKWAMHLGSYRLSFMNDNTDTTAIPGTSSVAAYSRTFWDKIAFTPAGHLLVAGSVGIGTSSPTRALHVEDNAANTSASDWRIGGYIIQKINPLATSSSTFSALEGVAMVNGSSDITTAYGGRGGLQTNGTNNITNALGWTGLTYVPTASTVTNAYGTKGEVRTNHASASVTNAYAGSFAVTRTLGTITNGMGVYIGTIQATNKWGLYSVDSTANNYFAGNVGIGTTSPTTPLSVSTAQGTSGGILVADATDANNPRVQLRTSNPNGNGVIEVLDNTEAVKIQLHGNGASYITSGNVGIGTTAPALPLHVVGGQRISAGGLQLYNEDNWNSVIAYNFSTSKYSALRGIRGRGTAASPASVQAGDFLTIFDAYGYDSASTTAYAGGMSVNAETTFSSAVNSYLMFSTTSAGTNAERVRITSAGNVGIGTTTPAAKLDVNGFMRLAKNGSAPATCDATIDGAIALTSQYTLCACKGGSSAWVITTDGTTACTW